MHESKSTIATQLLCLSNHGFHPPGDKSEKNASRHLPMVVFLLRGRGNHCPQQNYMSPNSGTIQWCLGITATHNCLKNTFIVEVPSRNDVGLGRETECRNSSLHPLYFLNLSFLFSICLSLYATFLIIISVLFNNSFILCMAVLICCL